ncbi:hypothetical protein [Nesterenkonia pannonica]|uniref:hypothetical protein n=1 Tax=Nesterenkonia pannonica TaxID=1548602 RepID=UPI002164231C|nr:hypothetical protein [Nesterenkonia pannonica]
MLIGGHKCGRLSGVALAMVLSAAVFHAVWNLAAKTARGDTTVLIWMYYSMGCLITLPIGIVRAVVTGADHGWELPWRPWSPRCCTSSTPSCCRPATGRPSWAWCIRWPAASARC